MFQIILIDPEVGTAFNPFKINMIPNAKPVGGNTIFVSWFWDDDEVGL